jgi:hypothetical protein
MHKNSHIIQQHFFFGEISPIGNKKKPSSTFRKEFLKRTSKTFAICLRKKRKRKKISSNLNNESV